MLKTTSLLAVASVVTPAILSAASTQLITNGDFETGDFTGWTNTTAPGSGGSISLDAPGTPAPLFGFDTAPNPGGGAFYAVSDQGGPGTYSLAQAFTIPDVDHCEVLDSVILSFEMFVNNQGGPTTVGIEGLDHTGGANQHGRVDLLSAGAGAFDTGAGVLQNLYLGADAGTNPNPYTLYNFDLTSLAPGDYQIRFSETDNQGFFNLGVDNVSIVQSTTTVVCIPEPSNVLFLSGLLVSGLIVRTRRSSRF